MMDLHHISLWNGSTAIRLGIKDASASDDYILKAADGLGPPEADVSIANTLYQGGIYQGRRPQNREIVLRIGLNPNYRVGQTVAQLRAELYNLWNSHQASGMIDVFMRDINDDPIMYAAGYMKKVEIVPFSQEPEIQLTIACPRAYMQHITNITEYSIPWDLTSPIIPSVGTAPSGFYLSFTALNDTADIRITNTQTGQFMGISSYVVGAGEVLEFETRAGIRQVRIAATGVHLEDYLINGSEWLELYPGDNFFQIDGWENWSWGAFQYQPQYLGV